MSKDEQKKEMPIRIKARKKFISKPIVSIIIVAAFVVLGYKLWENPLLLEQAKDMLFYEGKKDDVHQTQITALQNQVNSLQETLSELEIKVSNPDFSDINKRIDDIQQISINTIKSKADVEAVLGLVVRMDNVEGKVNNLAKVTNESALILTAAMLVKDAGERGGEFVYEAEVLSELATENYKIAKEVSRLNELAVDGIPSVEELQKSFSDIFMLRYPDVAEDEVIANNWKDRIYHQINKVVKIKNKNDENQREVEISQDDKVWLIVNDVVMSGDINKAMAIIRKPINKSVAEDENMVSWLKKADMYKDFYDAISRISANSLAVMKANFLKNNKNGI